MVVLSYRILYILCVNIININIKVVYFEHFEKTKTESAMGLVWRFINKITNIYLHSGYFPLYGGNLHT